MKKILSIILVLLLIASITPTGLFSVTASAATNEFAGGSGTEEDPYKISTLNQLCNVSKYPDAYYVLINDITVTSSDQMEDWGMGSRDWKHNGWNPIGSEQSPFTGVFDGKGYTISGLYMSSVGNSPKMAFGLFGYSSGTIRNLAVKNSTFTVTIDGDAYGSFYVGGVVGYQTGRRIANCTFEGEITASTSTEGYYPYAAGIVGGADTTSISYCENKGTIYAAAVSSYSIDDICGYLGNAVDITTVDGYYTYNMSNGEATIINCDTSISGDVTIPSTLGGYPVTAISGFYDCKKVTGITIPNGVTYIGEMAFYNCPNIMEITIPDSVEFINVEALSDTGYYKNSNNWENGALYINNHLIKVKNDFSGIYTIKEGTKTISSNAFENNDNITSVIIPDSVIGIGFRAFSNCDSITNITIPRNVISIGGEAFSYCSNLEKVNFKAEKAEFFDPNNEHSGIFSSSNSLKKINFDSTVKLIPKKTVTYCNSFESITIPDSVTSIGERAFYDCKAFTDVFYKGTEEQRNSIEIGASNENILNATWYYNVCADDTKHVYDSTDDIKCNVCDHIRTIIDYSFLTYTISNGEVRITDCDNSVSGDVTIPSEIDGYPVTSIWANAFWECSRLTSITIPNSVTRIDVYAFKECTSLASIIIPDSVTTIGGSAFEECTSLASIIIPDSVTSIGDRAFYDTAYYNNSNNWDSNVLYIGNHLIEAKTSISGTYAIKDGTRCIGTYAFMDCESLTNITIPNSVTSIDYGAFRECTSLTNITIPNSVTSIGGYAFRECTSLTSITIPNSVTTIGFYAFENCSNLKSITISNRVPSIESSTFYNCSSLTSIIIPNSVTSIGKNAFNSCSNLKSITIPISVTSIGERAFNYCSRLEDVWYVGTKAEKNITISSYNAPFTSASWHYNACPIGAEHSYDNTCDTTCNICEYTRTITHDYEWVTDKSATCITTGIKHEECTVCHIKRNENITIDVTGSHTFEWVVDKANNCGETGSKHEECTVCHTKQNENTVIEATGDHKYDNTCDTICNVCKQTRAITHTYDNACDAICNICNNVRAVPDHSYTLNSNHTCDICKYSKTPSSPIIESKTNSSVTLIKIEGFEYSKDGSTWQDSNVFSNLSPSTTYTFYQRVKASTTAFVSETSEGRSVTFKSAQSAPSSPIISSFTDATVTLVPNANYEYSKDGITWQTSNVFKDLNPVTRYTFYQRYAETDTHEASNRSTGTSVTTDKSKQTLIPNAPTVQSFTSNSITLTPVDGCEYSKNGTTWQSSNVFSGLSCGTEYTFYQRYKETTTTYAGKSSPSLVTKTDKGTQSKPSAPTVLSKTYNSVTLTPISGYEYSRDGVNWQTSNVFTGLDYETNYMFYQRKAETNTYYSSVASAALTVKTNEPPACVLNPEFHDYDNNCDATCNTCGATRTITHDYKEATCTAPKTCKVCGVTEGNSLGHDYKEATCTSPKTCKVCGATTGKANGHDYKAATCTTPQTCKVCKATNGKALGHNYKDATCTKAKTCTRCNATSGSALGHKYTKITTVKATTSKDGYVLTECSVCGVDKSKTTIYYPKTVKLSTTSYTYSGSAKKPSVTVKDSKGKTISSKYYTVTYASGRKYVGKYKVTVKFKGNYSGTKTLYFTINPGKTTVSKLTAGKKNITVAISKKSTQVSGYQIQYSTSKKFTSAKTKTLISYKTTKYTIKSLSAKKPYYVRVRTYKTVKGVKYYSGWSTYKSAKTK